MKKTNKLNYVYDATWIRLWFNSREDVTLWCMFIIWRIAQTMAIISIATFTVYIVFSP